MEDFRFHQYEPKEDVKNLYPLIKELRVNLSLEDFLGIYEYANTKNDYQIVAIEKEQTVIALMGYRILYDFVHGKHLYIDDLIITKVERNKGYGRILLTYAETIAKESQCNGLRLCTGIDNENGKKFYERQNWKLRAVVFKKKLTDW
ncbi:MAG: GNAT family N-acetyltransferase [Pseudobdellovibrionaceae bacterium]